MTTLEDLYIYYCRRCDCRPNKQFCCELQAAYEASGGLRQLERIDMSNNYVGPKGVAPVLELARNIHNLVLLDLRNNLIESEQLEMLVRALARHPSVRSVDLSNNRLDDADLPSILFLLKSNANIVELRLGGNEFLPSSLQRIDEQLCENHKQSAAQRMAESNIDEAAQATRDNRPVFLPHKSEVRGELTTANSGGHFHFASWRKNPQYQLYVSTNAVVSITLKVEDPIPTKQFGFAVLKGKGLIKVIEVRPEDILVESAFDHESCKVQLRLAAANRNRCDGPYIIVPFSFQPQRTGKFVLQCEIVEEPGCAAGGGIEDGAFLTVEPLDSRYDWEVNEVHGTWSTDNAGGSAGHASWRDNQMYHVEYRGTAAARHTASLYIVLTKSNDTDINDEREIGMYIVKKNERGPGTPLLLTAENTIASVDHRRDTSVTLHVDTSCGSLDWYIIPTTAQPAEFGDYTLTVFSTCQLSITPQHHPHGWSYQALTGIWDHQRNGGCRKDNPVSWVHNPSYLLHQEHDAPIGLFASLEVVAAGNGDIIEGQLQLLQYDVPDFGPMKVSPFSRKEAIVSLQYLPKGVYVLVPTTRTAGQHGEFRLRLFTEKSVLLSKESSLNARIRETQLQQYALENEQRRKESTDATAAALLMPAQQGGDEFVAASAEKEAAIQAYLATGALHCDREFPRGESSLWLGIDVAPEWAPGVAAWRRPSELVFGVPPVCAPSWSVDQVKLSLVGLQNDWFFSALNIVSTRPEWLARVFRGYDPAYGIAQFSFFKNGQWHAVSIDDYLPVDAVDELCFCTSHTRKNDVFLPLIEKAYAKYHRCYHALDQRLSADRASPATLIKEAIMDLTGGLCWDYDVFSEADAIAQSRQSASRRTADGSTGDRVSVSGDALWQVLKTCRESDRAIAVSLSSDAPNSIEKQHVGLIRDRAYAVLDARMVEGVRLVQLQQFWPDGDSVAPFSGQWAAGSARWTSSMMSFVDFKPSRTSFWMSLEEIEYYFSRLFIAKQYRHATFIEGGFSPAHVGGPIQSDTWVENPQYALDIIRGDDETPAGKPVTITVGIHQPDGRATVTRHQDALITYATSIGVTVFFTGDNTRRLATLSPSEYVVHSPIVQGRDCFMQIVIDPKVHPASNRVILMPFHTTPKVPLQCFLSVWTDDAPAALSLIQSSTRTICEGEWRAGSSGGPPLCGTWRNNPQYHLYPSEGMEVTIVLRQRNDLSSTEDFIGFTVHRATGLRSLLHYSESDVVLSVRHENGHAVAGTVRLCGMQERRGMPYVIVPTCTKAHVETGFTLEVIANKKVHLCRIPAETDWRSVVFPVTFKYSDRNTGGSTRFSSWRNNPQFLIRCPLERQGDILVSVSNRSVSDDTEIGVMLLKSDPWDYGRRRKLIVNAEDIIKDSGEAAHTSELQTTVSVKANNEPIVLMPYTATPLSEVAVTVSIFAAMDIEVDVVSEWYTEVVDGSWELGLNAGGNRREHRTWLNNPFFALNLTKQTRFTAVLLQYPRGPEKLEVKRVGKLRPYLLPPITNPQNKISIGMDVVESNEDNTPIASTRHTYDGEVTLSMVLPPCETTPYFFVPHSFDPEQEADFKIMLYADQPFQLQEYKKVRRYF